MNKYHAKKTYLNGESFDSKKEARRYAELKLMQRAGAITDLQRQVRYLLIPTQYDDNGRCVEKCCTYVADFVYKRGNELVVEDTKGLRTEVYRIKKKLMLERYGIRVFET